MEEVYEKPSLHREIELLRDKFGLLYSVDPWSEQNVEALEYVEEVVDEYDVPIDPNRITVLYGKLPILCHGMASAIGCGEYTYEQNGCLSESVWSVENKPREYVIWVNNDSSKEKQTIRHELAHIVNWEEEQYTVEGRGIHKEWLEHLDAL